MLQQAFSKQYLEENIFSWTNTSARMYKADFPLRTEKCQYYQKKQITDEAWFH
jgi:hypothetical protein